MSIWNKVLLGFIAVAALVFFHAALRTVKTFKYWSGLHNSFETKIDSVQKEVVRLRTADHEHPLDDKSIGVQQLRTDLSRMLTSRGRIWTNCQKKSVQPERNNGQPTGRFEVTVTTDESSPSDRALLYVFEEGDDQTPGKYLGEFAVKGVNEKDINLVSTTQPSVLQLKNLNDSKTTWVLYEMIPSDQHEVFATLPDDKRKQWFPEDNPTKFFSDEYTKDGQTINNQPFERKLRDYLEFFRVCEVERTLYDDKLNALQRDEAYLNSAKSDSENQLVFAGKEKVQTKQVLDWEVKQKQATVAHYGDLQTMLNFNVAAVKELIEANASIARQIAKIQKEAADQIERRSQNLARIGAGAN
jgi:hypothetical protein